MPKFRKKPVVIDAVQFTDNESAEQIIKWAGNPPIEGIVNPNGDYERLAIDTMEGTMTASHGDYVICGVQGEFYPCKPDIFDATYEPAEYDHA